MRFRRIKIAGLTGTFALASLISVVTFPSAAQAADFSSFPNGLNGSNVFVINATDKKGSPSTLNAQITHLLMYMKESGTRTLTFSNINKYGPCKSPDTAALSLATLSVELYTKRSMAADSKIAGDSFTAGDEHCQREKDIKFKNYNFVDDIPGHEGYKAVYMKISLTDGSLGDNRWAVSSSKSSDLISTFTGRNLALISTNETQNISVAFGPDCSVKTETEAELNWKDADYNVEGVQGNGKDFFTEVYEYDLDGSGKKKIAHLEGKKNLGGNGAKKSTKIDVKPDKKYIWTWYNVWPSNGIDITLPYDGIFYSVPCNDGYGLKPTISRTPQFIESTGGTVNLTGTVTNTTDSMVVDNVTWNLVRFLVPKGTNQSDIPGASTGGNEPEVYYGNKGLFNATELDANTVTFKKGSTTLHRVDGREDVLPGDYQLGDQICYGLAVNKYDQDKGQDDWRYSAPACVRVSISPKVNIINGDLHVGMAFAGTEQTEQLVSTSVSIKAGKTYGSMVDYAILATGMVHNTASGAKYQDGLQNASACLASPLTFYNAGPSESCSALTELGGYQTAQALPDISSFFPTSEASKVTSASIDPTALPSSGSYTTTRQHISLTGGTMPKGKWIVLNMPNTTLAITGDLLYSNEPLTSLNDIPQLVIIAKKIEIRNSVQRLDTWLVAKSDGGDNDSGTIKTCSDITGTDTLNGTKCKNSLVVNGPVTAAHLLLWRTSGSNTGQAAETFNMRPDAYLWAYRRAEASNQVMTTGVTELPPRF